MIVRELSLERAARAFDAAAVAEIRAAADVRVLIAPAMAERAEALAAVVRSAGGGAFVNAAGDVMVAASHAVLQGAARSSEDEEAVAVRSVLDAYERLTAAPAQVRMRERTLDLADEARVMGIVNVTPDSFYDRATNRADVIARAHAIVAAGGALIDIGGQSYAHWNARVTPEEEISRVVPAVEAIRAAGIDAALSIDTFKASVADAALAAGAHIINDCSGLSDPALVDVVAKHDAALVIMHLKGELNVRNVEQYSYDDVMAEIIEFLYERVERAVRAGVRRESIVVDPGLEFGKEPRTDLEILERFGELRVLGLPLLLASSRKSFIGRIFGRPAKELLVPSLATAAIGIGAGARMLRVHDVAETVQLARTFAAITPTRRASLPLAEAMPGTPVA